MKTLVKKIKSFIFKISLGDLLCKIGLHKFNYTYTTTLSAWSTYSGYCERCEKYKSGITC